MKRAALQVVALSLATLFSMPSAYATPGSIDPTFDTTVDGGSAEEKARDVAVGASGKVYVLNQIGEAQYKVLRFKAGGALDTTFGNGGGIAFTAGNVIASGVESFLAMAVDEAGGAVYVGGGIGSFGGSHMLVKKLLFTGSFDTNYGSGGQARVETFRDGAVIRMAFQGDKLVLAGVDGVLGLNGAGEVTIVDIRPYIARLTAGGVADATFFKQAIYLGEEDSAPSGITVLGSGKLLVTAITGLVESKRAGTGSALIRVKSAGALDDTFGTGGIVTRDFATGTCTGEPTDTSCEVTGLYYPQPNGEFLVSIYVDRPDTSKDRILVQRYKGNGRRLGAPMSFPADDYLEGGTPVVAPGGRVVVADETPTDLRVYRIEGYSVIGLPNHAPVAVNDSFTVVKNSIGNRRNPLLNDSDPDGDALTIVKRTAPAHGTVKLNSTNTRILYTPTSGYQGQDSFTYTITDGRNARSTATINVTVAP